MITLSGNPRYRLDLQFLRGISVILVFLYHLKIPGFQNGFLGVDIFFVLSGFLMAKLAEKASPLEFYSRRLKRLLPAYLVVIFFTTLIVSIITIPSDSNQRTDRIFYDLLALSNISFWSENSYFESNAFRPLLNLWSLAVELQFYLLAPFILPFLKKRKLLLGLVILLSLLGSMVLITISPKTSFFMLPTRLWEFLFGAFAAWHFVRNSTPKVCLLLGLLSALCLFFVFAFYPLPNDSLNVITGHPSLAALLVVISTTILLIYSIDKFISIKFFMSRIFIKLGDYSYSIYLTHFPIIVLVNYVPFGATRLGFEGTADLITIVLLTIFTSYLLFNYVEKIRYTKYASISILLIIAVCLSMSYLAPKINSSNFSKNELLIYNAWKDRSVYRCGKISRVLNPTSKVCTLGDEFEGGRVLLLGGSHADSIKTVFRNEMNDKSNTALFYVANNPLMSHRDDENILINVVLRNSISSVVIHFNSGFYNDGNNLKRLTAFIKMLEQHEVNVFFIAPVPTADFLVPKKMVEIINDATLSIAKKDYSKYLAENASFLGFVDRLNIGLDDVWYPHTVLCPENKCLIERDGAPFYFDSHHLTLTGAQELKPLLNDIAARTFK